MSGKGPNISFYGSRGINGVQMSYKSPMYGNFVLQVSYWCHYDIFHTREASQGFNNYLDMKTNVLGLKDEFKARGAKAPTIPIEWLFCL